MTGACFCKAIKYEVLAEVDDAGSVLLRRLSDGRWECLLWRSYAISPDDFRLTSGELKKYTSRSAAG